MFFKPRVLKAAKLCPPSMYVCLMFWSRWVILAYISSYSLILHFRVPLSFLFWSAIAPISATRKIKYIKSWYQEFLLCTWNFSQFSVLSISISLCLSSSKILIIAKGTSLQIPKTWAWTSKSSTSPTKPRHSKSPAATYCWFLFTIQTTNQGPHGLLLQSAGHWYIDIPPPQQKPRPPLPLPKITQIPFEWSLT